MGFSSSYVDPDISRYKVWNNIYVMYVPIVDISEYLFKVFEEQTWLTLLSNKAIECQWVSGCVLVCLSPNSSETANTLWAKI